MLPPFATEPAAGRDRAPIVFDRRRLRVAMAAAPALGSVGVRAAGCQEASGGVGTEVGTDRGPELRKQKHGPRCCLHCSLSCMYVVVDLMTNEERALFSAGDE